MHNLHILPKSVLIELDQIVHEFEPKGIDLILFGSFAEGKGRLNSDLDLAYDSQATPKESIQKLHNRIEDLHTVRSVDLVDLQKVSDDVAKEIRTNGRLLRECVEEILNTHPNKYKPDSTSSSRTKNSVAGNQR